MPSSPAYTLRRALPADLPFLTALRHVTMRAVIEQHYPWEETVQHARILAHFECAQIIAAAGRDVGLFKVVPQAHETHLSQIQLLPEYQGKGIASALIRALQIECAPSGRPLTLDVLRYNPALALYRRLHFAIEREDEHFYFMRWTPGPREPNKSFTTRTR